MSVVLSAQIRRALPEDASLIQEIVREAYAKWVPMIGREPLPMQVDYDQAVRAHEIDLLSLEARVVGLIETIRHPDHLWIENVAVRPASQGQGVGRLLLSHAERRASAAGFDGVRLLTNAAFEANVALYERCGYAVDRREPFMGGVTLYLSKRLR